MSGSLKYSIKVLDGTLLKALESKKKKKKNSPIASFLSIGTAAPLEQAILCYSTAKAKGVTKVKSSRNTSTVSLRVVVTECHSPIFL